MKFSMKVSFLPRPTVNVQNPDLDSLTIETWGAIERANNPPELFQCEGIVVNVPMAASDGSRRCREASVNVFRWWLLRKIAFIKINKKDESEEVTRPPADLYPNLLVTPNPPLPRLLGVVAYPIFAPDGALQTTKGYSTQTCFIYAPPVGFKLPPIPSNPSPDQIEHA